MIVEYTRTYLEMTAPDQLSPAASSAAVRLEPVDGRDPLLGELFARVGAPHHWPRWVAPAPRCAHWLIFVGGGASGVSTLLRHPAGEVEIESFGLLPTVIGRGFGGAALTTTVRLAWEQAPVDGTPIRRVWLHTSSLDHPRALRNYLRRGFQVVGSEERTKEVDDLSA